MGRRKKQRWERRQERVQQEREKLLASLIEQQERDEFFDARRSVYGVNCKHPAGAGNEKIKKLSAF